MNFDFDADPEPGFDFYADPDTLRNILRILAHPDPTFHFDADPDPVHVMKTCADWSTDPPRLHF
jgi:hypothetical protein